MRHRLADSIDPLQHDQKSKLSIRIVPIQNVRGGRCEQLVEGDNGILVCVRTL